MIDIYVDGASKDNNVKGAIRRASICVIVPQYNFKLVESIGNKTNNEAEWGALVKALEIANRGHWKNVRILSDSQLVVEQFNDRWRCKHENLETSYLRAKTLAGLFNNLEVVWIRRDKNLAGIELERIG